LRSALFSCVALIALPGVALAQSQTAPASPSDKDAAQNTIVVTARRLDEAHASIQPSLGADSYAISQDAIQAMPGGDNQQFNQILLQIPGVSQDGGGQFHVRDDHANLQYRINGTILPEGLAVFGQTLSPRLIDHFALLTGALPAQYGLRTAGIMDITTKSGMFANGGQISLYGGSHGSINPSFSYGGSSGNTNYFVSGDFKHNGLGIESVDGSSTPCMTRPTRGRPLPMSITSSTPTTASALSADGPASISRSPIRAGFPLLPPGRAIRWMARAITSPTISMRTSWNAPLSGNWRGCVTRGR
jgi:hypothetical protein